MAMKYTIDLKSVSTLHQLHEHLKQIFSLPEYYGMNMDALWDCLFCAFEEPVVIELLNTASVPAALANSVKILCSLLKRLEVEDENVTVVVQE
ncbi:MAG: barstar family protein [Acutalibacter sp.]|nr:barstar family protein [Acutalibacter sp.]